MPRSMGRTDADLTLGRKLRERRIMQGYSQMRLGDELGCSFQQIQKYEKGVNRMAVSTLLQICDILECNPTDILEEVKAGDKAPEEGRKQDMLLMRHFQAIPDGPDKAALFSMVRAMADTHTR